MTPFSAIRARAEARKGGPDKLAALLPRGPRSRSAETAPRRPGARRDDQTRLLRRLRLERDRGEVAGLRGGVSGLRPGAARLRAGRLLGRPRCGTRASSATARKSGRCAGTPPSSRRSPGSTAASARFWRAGRRRTRSASSTSSPSEATGSAACRARCSFASSAGTASRPRRDVVACLRDAGLDIAAEPKSKGDLQRVQAQFNDWAEETGLPYVHLSRICACSIGENHGAAARPGPAAEDQAPDRMRRPCRTLGRAQN